MARSEAKWLQQAWGAADELIRCSLCVPDLTPRQREFVRLRWLEESKHYDRLWRRHRLRDYCFRIPIIAGSATVPVLVSLGAGRVAPAVVGLGVAVLATLDGVFQFGPRWRQLRQTATEMTREGWSFLKFTGDYGEPVTHTGAWWLFLDRLEALNAQRTEGYVRLFREHPLPQGVEKEAAAVEHGRAHEDSRSDRAGKDVSESSLR